MKIININNTDFLINQQIKKFLFEKKNEQIITTNNNPTINKPLLLNITKTSLSTKSFINTNSFQKTTKILTKTSISNKINYLQNLKKNMIINHLIPTNTNIFHYKHLNIDIINKKHNKLDTVT